MTTIKEQTKDACKNVGMLLRMARQLTAESCSDMRRSRPATAAIRAWVDYYKANQHAIYMLVENRND
jgi:hypothetical protein